MIEMVVARVNRCSKIQKPPKGYRNPSEAYRYIYLLETSFHGFLKKVEDYVVVLLLT